MNQSVFSFLRRFRLELRRFFPRALTVDVYIRWGAVQRTALAAEATAGAMMAALLRQDVSRGEALLAKLNEQRAEHTHLLREFERDFAA